MERQLPKNVRQIGNVSDSPKIYVEDYVCGYVFRTAVRKMREVGKGTNGSFPCGRYPDGNG